MGPIVFIVVLTLIIGWPTFRRFWFIRGQVSPESIHVNVLSSYADEHLKSAVTEIVPHAGVEIPMVTSMEEPFPLVMSSVTLLFGSVWVNERTLPVYCTAIRIGICIQNTNHQDVLLYRHPKSVFWTRKGPFQFENKRGLDVLSPQQRQAVDDFIQENNSVRYRAIKGSHDIIVPPGMKENIQDSDCNMILSTEYFSPQSEPEKLAAKIEALKKLARELESSH